MSDRLELLSAIAHSLQNDPRPRPPVAPETLTRFRGLLNWW
ncbi:hypothetical protein [Nostoc sp.]